MNDPFADETDYPPLRLLRITQKPYKAVLAGRKQWCFHLSDGRVVNLYELADIVGIKQPSMFERVRTLKWNDPNMLVKRRKRRRKEVDLSHIERGALAHLSGRARV